MVDAPAKRRFWDNLIPLRGSLFGEQLGGWTPGPPVISGLGCTMLSDQPIPVADNVSLAADIYLPQRPRRARPDAAAARREIAVRRRQPHRSAAERCQPRPRAFRLPVPPYLSRYTLHYGAETYLELQRIGRNRVFGWEVEAHRFKVATAAGMVAIWHNARITVDVGEEEVSAAGHARSVAAS